MSSNQVDGVSFPVSSVLENYSKLPVKATLLLDQSTSGDAVLAGKGVTSLKSLQGKSVAFEDGTTSQLLLSAALSKDGMSFSDIKSVPTPADQAAGVLVSGRSTAAVTYQPYISTAVAGGTVHSLVTAAEFPGLISDALYLQNSYLKAHPAVAAALATAWNKSITFYKAHPTQAKAIIAKALGASVSSLSTAFKGAKFYTLADNASELNGSFKTTTLPLIQKAMISAGMMKTKVDLSDSINATGVDKAAGK
nr:ABC transporter substrate-binding protein [Frondihabitans sp. PAMC 28766]